MIVGERLRKCIDAQLVRISSNARLDTCELYSVKILQKTGDSRQELFVYMSGNISVSGLGKLNLEVQVKEA